MKSVGIALLLLVSLTIGAVAGEINGQVTDVRGNAVPGAVVIVNALDDNGNFRAVRTVTNERGVFSFELNRYEGTVLVQAFHRRLGRDAARVNVPLRGSVRAMLVLPGRERGRGHRVRGL